MGPGVLKFKNSLAENIANKLFACYNGARNICYLLKSSELKLMVKTTC